MKIPSLLFAAPSFVVLVGIAFASASTPESGRAAADHKSSGVASAGPESALQWAMPADAVRRIMGQPQEVKPMEAPNGKAEIWIYTRQLGTHMDRIPIGAVPIMTTNSTVVGSGNNTRPGPATQQKIGESIVYADVVVATVETVEVLMFNDHFVTQKVTRQDVRHYN